MKILQKLFLPITLLTILSVLCLIVLAEALYMHFVQANIFSEMYLKIAIPISLVIWGLYFFDRMLLKKITYKKILIVEIGIASLLVLIFFYQNSKTILQINTDKSFVIVLFDAPKNTTINFVRSGLFNKKLIIEDKNIVHLPLNISFEKNFSIETPKEWKRTTTDQSSIFINGKKVKFTFVTNSGLPVNYIINPEKYIDSLLNINAINN